MISGPWPNRLGMGFCSSLQANQHLKTKSFYIIAENRLHFDSWIWPRAWDVATSLLAGKSRTAAPGSSEHSCLIQRDSFGEEEEIDKVGSQWEGKDSKEDVTLPGKCSPGQRCCKNTNTRLLRRGRGMAWLFLHAEVRCNCTLLCDTYSDKQ